MFLILLGRQDVAYNQHKKTIKQTLNVLLFTLINPPQQSISLLKQWYNVSGRHLLKSCLSLPLHFKKKVIFPLLMKIHFFWSSLIHLFLRPSTSVNCGKGCTLPGYSTHCKSNSILHHSNDMIKGTLSRLCDQEHLTSMWKASKEPSWKKERLQQ